MGDVSWSPGRIAHFAFGILSTRLTLKPHKAPSFVTIAGHYPANYVTWFMKKDPAMAKLGLKLPAPIKVLIIGFIMMLALRSSPKPSGFCAS
ncbi:hypothetical protein CYJ40_07175 [Brevibacterium ravenspurgense]|uniref:Uncharacterized protein n=1 Tax=Brevibacterium ravenspurgense TaxID=479117 RepID=A0A150HBM5_9MICO|nr:hypothetical protein [Brevibacterium ravenspurgense]KXZ59208.1 hypothetical protein Bravens_00455 [Brevibacterium ravenspurgense]PKY70153.1 hypothetical protein CYJ40_07175 [Brevibacterium ravenspurgense]